MKLRALLVCTCLATVLAVGCSATVRRKLLTTLFDGVPPPKAASAAQPAPAAPPAGAVPERPSRWDHAPFAAKSCSDCHNSGAANALVVPKEDLCSQCHALDLNKEFVHGAIEMAGCLACHDPHTSRYRHLLVAEPDSLCLGCHDRDSLGKTPGHTDATNSCISCHDPHASDKQHMLK